MFEALCLFGRTLSLGLGLLVGSVAAAPLGFGDPTRPTGYVVESAAAQDTDREGPEQKPLPTWQLTSTLLSGNRRVAVINGRSVQPGEHIDGARLVSVGTREAIIETSGRRIKLRMAAPATEKLNTKTPSGR